MADFDACIQNENILNTLWSVWLDIMGIKDFADARFSGISGTLRDLVCMLALGLEELLKPRFDNPDRHKHWLNGFKLMNEQSRIMHVFKG